MSKKLWTFIKANWYHWLTLGLIALTKWLKDRKTT